MPAGPRSWLGEVLIFQPKAKRATKVRKPQKGKNKNKTACQQKADVVMLRHSMYVTQLQLPLQVPTAGFGFAT